MHTLYLFNESHIVINSELKKTKTATGTSLKKYLMSRTTAVRVRFNSWLISLPSSLKQRREITKFCVVQRTWTTTAHFLPYFKFIAVSQIQFPEVLTAMNKVNIWSLRKHDGDAEDKIGRLQTKFIVYLRTSRYFKLKHHDDDGSEKITKQKIDKMVKLVIA